MHFIVISFEYNSSQSNSFDRDSHSFIHSSIHPSDSIHRNMSGEAGHWLKNPTPKHAFYLSRVGVILEGISTSMGIGAYFWLGSALLLLYGLENFVDFISSAVVLWRFYAPGELTKEREAILNQREDRAAVAISFLILILGCLVIPAAVADLHGGTPSEEDVDEGLEVIIAISIVSIGVFFVMTVLKFYYAKVLNSESLHKDGLCSVIGLLLSCLICINSWLINNSPELWRVDGQMAISCGVVAILIGLHGIFRAIFVKKHHVFSVSFWQNSGKEESPEETPDSSEMEINAMQSANKLSEVV